MKGDASQGQLLWFFKISFLVPGTAPGGRGGALSLDHWSSDAGAAQTLWCPSASIPESCLNPN